MTATVALIGFGGAGKALAADSAPTDANNNPPPAAQSGTMNDDADAPDEKTYDGNITTVNKDAHTFSVKGLLFSKTFNASKQCKISLQDTTNGASTFASLQPGQDVEVRYENYDGVLIAHEVDQHDMTYTGHITAIDLNAHKMTIKHGLMSHSFVLSPECGLTLQGTKAGTLNNLQLGDAVTVTYQSVKGDNVAEKVEAKGAEFTGVIQSMDASNKTIEARDAYGNGPDRKFNLADNCSIVINGKTDGTVSNLKAGERVEFNYENEDGILVTTRIGVTPDQTAGLTPRPSSDSRIPVTATTNETVRKSDE